MSAVVGTSEAAVKVTVLGPFQVRHGGRNYVPGETFSAPVRLARAWVRDGYVADPGLPPAVPDLEDEGE